MNGHVNNVSFIDWAVESTPRAVADAAQLTDLQMEFRAEALLGDEVLTQSAHTPESGAAETIFNHRLTHAQDGRILALARSVWQTGAG